MATPESIKPPLSTLSLSALTFVLAVSVSSFGSAITTFALNVWVYKETGSYAIFATLSTLAALPALIFSPVAGVLVDRMPRKPLLIVCQFIAAVAVLGLLISSALNFFSPWLVGAVMVTLSLVRTVAWPATAATVTILTKKEERPRINGIAETLDGAALIISPILGAILFEWVSMPGVVAFDLATYLLCVCVVLSITFPVLQLSTNVDADTQTSPFKKLLQDCTFGFRWIAARRDMLKLLLFFILINLGAATYVVTFVPYILSFADVNFLGICSAATGAGFLVGGLIFAASGGMKQSESGVLWGAIIMGVAMIGIGFTRSDLWLLPLAFFYGVSFPLTNASAQTIWQDQVPPDQQGRVFSVRRMIAFCITPLAMIASIPLSAHIFKPIVEARGQLAPFSTIWGIGDAGAFGLMISASGAYVFAIAAFLLATGGLKIRAPAALGSVT